MENVNFDAPLDGAETPEENLQVFHRMETPEQRYLKTIAKALEGIERTLEQISRQLRTKK